MAVNRDTPVRGLVWVGRRLRFVGSFLALGVVAATCTWLALVTLSGLSALFAATAGLEGAGATVSHGVVLLVAVVGLAVGGLLADRALGESAVGVGALVAGVGALAFAALPGAMTTALVALCGLAGVGLLLPALVVRARDRGGSRPGTALALVGVGYLLANAVVLSSWYSLANWLGLIATSHLLADGVVGIPPRVLVYETFGSWWRALLAAGGSLVVVATIWFAVVGRPSSERLRDAVADSGSGEWTLVPAWARERSALAVWLVAACVAWTVAAGLLVFSGAVDALTAPIMALAARLLAVLIPLGLLAGGLATDRFGVRPVLGTAVVGTVAGPAGYSAAAGPATDFVGATPPGTPWLVLTLLVTALAVGALVVCLFALPLLIPDAGADQTGTAAGLALGTTLLGALLARALVPVDGRASPLALVMLAVPALVALAALRWLERQPAETTPTAADHASGERG